MPGQPKFQSVNHIPVSKPVRKPLSNFETSPKTTFQFRNQSRNHFPLSKPVLKPRWKRDLLSGLVPAPVSRSEWFRNWFRSQSRIWKVVSGLVSNLESGFWTGFETEKWFPDWFRNWNLGCPGPGPCMDRPRSQPQVPFRCSRTWPNALLCYHCFVSA